MKYISLLVFGAVSLIPLSGATTPLADDGGKRHPLEGTWQLLSYKIGDGNDAAPANPGEVELKVFTRGQMIWLVYNQESKVVLSGAGGSCTWKDNSYEETIRYLIGPNSPAGLLDRTYKSTWKIQSGKLQVSGEYDGVKAERTWERVK